MLVQLYIGMTNLAYMRNTKRWCPTRASSKTIQCGAVEIVPAEDTLQIVIDSNLDMNYILP